MGVCPRDMKVQNQRKCCSEHRESGAARSWTELHFGYVGEPVGSVTDPESATVLGGGGGGGHDGIRGAIANKCVTRSNDTVRTVPWELVIGTPPGG